MDRDYKVFIISAEELVTNFSRISPLNWRKTEALSLMLTTKHAVHAYLPSWRRRTVLGPRRWWAQCPGPTAQSRRPRSPCPDWRPTRSAGSTSSTTSVRRPRWAWTHVDRRRCRTAAAVTRRSRSRSKPYRLCLHADSARTVQQKYSTRSAWLTCVRKLTSSPT